MPLGIVSDDEFLKELELCQHTNMPSKGRNNKLETPEIIREIVAEEAIIGGKTQQEIADEFGLSKSSVSAYKNGATSTTTYNDPDDRLKKHNDLLRQNIVSSARERLRSALSHITPEKLAAAKVRDVAAVAKDMSAIIANTEPQSVNQNNGVQFIFHVPKQKSETDFDVIDVH